MYLLRHSLLGSWILVAFHAIYDYCKQNKRIALQQYMLELKPSIYQYNMLLCTMLLLSHFSRVQLCATHRRQPTRLLCPWDSPGKNTGVGCHFLLQCMKVKSESEVTQSCPALSNPMDCSLPGSSAHGIFQARVLEWGAITIDENKYKFSKANASLIYYYGTCWLDKKI